FDAGSDIDRLRRAGLNIVVDQTEYHMHHKFALFDRRLLLTGSYNWTRGAAEYNEENLLVTNLASLVKRYAGEFDKLWNRLT
ncbi:MAG: endonuclease, partial [Planctomycetales bacterium]|nr:endonuclease [Planctomycetales bacterium]